MKHSVLFGLAVGMVLLSSSAHALNLQSHRYYFHTGRADTLVESKPAPADTMTFSFSGNVGLDSLEFANSAGLLPGVSVVDVLTTFDFGVNYSFSDRLAVSINLPLHLTRNAISLVNLTKETSFSIGDVSVAGHLSLLDRDSTSSGFGLGIVPFVTMPTGSASNFVGDSGVTGGVLIAGDIELPGENYIGINTGIRLRKEENLANLRVSHEFLYGVAYHRPIVADQELDAFAEVQGSTVLGDFFSQANSTPIEAKIGLSKVINVTQDNPITVKLVNGLGFGNGYGSPDYRGTLQVTYDHIISKTKVVEKTVTVSRVERVEQRLKELTIYYPTDGSQVDPFYDQKIQGIAQLMKENSDLHPLYILGHTDDVGSDEYNQKLSERRAKQAFDSIVKYGLNSHDVVYVGLGEGHPVASNDTDANKALNRRTIFTFQKPTYLMEGMGNFSGERYRQATNSDSYTETLKARESRGLPTDNVKYQKVKVEDVQVEENQSTKTIPEPKRKNKKSSVEEKDLGAGDDFREPFAD